MMSDNNQAMIQLLNTAIVKSKEKRIDISYEERLAKTCGSEAVESISVAIDHLAQKLNVSRDQATMQIVDVIRELDTIWNDYLVMEGLSNLKDSLKTPKQ